MPRITQVVAARMAGLSDWFRYPQHSNTSLMGRYDRSDGIHHISPARTFHGGEEGYDEIISGANRGQLLANGLGAWRLAMHHAGRPIERWAEIGAGGGSCTLGLVAAAPGSTKIITDTSPAFLHMIKRKLAAAGIPEGECYYATLAGEDLRAIPPCSLDALIVAAALHHVGDWRAFIADAARVLRRGGVLVMQEPFREGNLLLNMAMEIALHADWGAAITESDRAKIEACRDSIYLLSDGTVLKEGEDKHNFLLDDMHDAAQIAGFSAQTYYTNAHFENFVTADLSQRHIPCPLSGYLLAFLEHHHRVSADGIALLKDRLTPALAALDHLYLQGDGPPILSSVVLTR